MAFSSLLGFFFTSSPGGGRIDRNVNGCPLMSVQDQRLRKGRKILYFHTHTWGGGWECVMRGGLGFSGVFLNKLKCFSLLKC